MLTAFHKCFDIKFNSSETVKNFVYDKCGNTLFWE